MQLTARILLSHPVKYLPTPREQLFQVETFPDKKVEKRKIDVFGIQCCELFRSPNLMNGAK